MKKMLKIFAIFNLIPLVSIWGLEFLPEIRAAYNYETDHLTRDIYGSGALYNFEFNLKIDEHSMPFVSLGYLHQNGKSLGGNDSTTLNLIPIDIGYKYVFLTKNIQPYLGLAMDISYIHLKNESPYVQKTQTTWGVGIKPKSGVLFFPTERFFIDLFLDYTYLPVSFSQDGKLLVYNKKVDLSSLSIGGGVGYKF